MGNGNHGCSIVHPHYAGDHSISGDSLTAKEKNAVKSNKFEQSREICDFFVLFTYMYLYIDLNT